MKACAYNLPRGMVRHPRPRKNESGQFKPGSTNTNNPQDAPTLPARREPGEMSGYHDDEEEYEPYEEDEEYVRRDSKKDK